MAVGAKLSRADRRAVLLAVAALERKFGTDTARWGMRKHLEVESARKKVAKKVKLLRSQIRALEINLGR